MSRRQRIAVVLALTVAPLLAGAGTPDVDAPPAALVLLVRGKITLTAAASGGRGQSERLLVAHATIDAGRQFVVSQDAQATLLFLDNGHVEQIAASGTFKVTPGGCQPRTGVQEVKVPEANRVVMERCRNELLRWFSDAKARSPGDGIGHSSDTGRDSAARAELRPVFDSTVLAGQPTFAWNAKSKGTKYTLSLYLLEKPVWSTVTDSTQLEYPGDVPLKSDETYSWRVTTTSDDGKVLTLCGGVFHTASGPQRATAAALEKLLAKPEPPYLSLAAVWYEQNGLVPEAIAVDEQLLKQSPDAGVYRELADLYLRAGRAADAAQAQRRAADLEKPADGTK